MTKLLCNWLNNDVQISCYLDENNFVSELSSGFLIGEIFDHYGLQPDFKYFSKEKNLEAFLQNFSRLEPTLQRLSIKLDSDLVNDILNLNSNATTALLHNIFGVLRGRKLKDKTNNNNNNSFYQNQLEETKIKELLSKRLNLAKILKEKEFYMPGTIAKTMSGSLSLPKISPNKTNNNLIKRKTISGYKEAEDLKLEILKFESKKKTSNTNTTCTNIFTDEPIVDDKVFIEKIRMNMQNNLEARKQREFRRKRILSNQMNCYMQQQNELREKLLCEQLLRQSIEEKRIAVQLMQVRQEKQNLINNRLEQQSEIQKRRDQDFKNFLDREAELLQQYREEHAYEILQQQIMHENLRKQKLEERHQKHILFVRKIMEDIVDLSTKIAEYREYTGCLIPSAIYCDWLELFLHERPLYVTEANTCIAKVVDDDAARLLNELDFKDYRLMKNEWTPDMSCMEHEELGSLQNPILGNALKNIYSIVYPPKAPEKPIYFPNFKIKACILGKPWSGKTSICNFLSQTLNIHVISVDNLIARCIEAFNNKEEEEYVWKKIIGYSDVEIISSKDENKEDKSENEILDDKLDKNKSANNRSSKDKSVKNTSSPVKGSNNKFSEESPNVEIKEKSDLEKPTEQEQNMIEDRCEMERCFKPTAIANFGARCMACLELGEAIGDELVIEIIVEKIRSVPEGEGWILDAFPVSFNQLGLLESSLTFSKIEDLIPGYIGLDVPPPEAPVPESLLVSDPRPPLTPPLFKSGLDVVFLLDISDELSIRRSVRPLGSFDRPKEGMIINDEFLKEIDCSQVQHKLSSFEEEWPKLCGWFSSYSRLEIVKADLEINEIQDTIINIIHDFLNQRAKAEELLKIAKLEEEEMAEKLLAEKKKKDLEDQLAKQEEEEKLLAESRKLKKEKKTKDEARNKKITKEPTMIEEMTGPSIHPGSNEWVFSELTININVACILLPMWQLVEEKYLSNTKQMFHLLRIEREQIIDYLYNSKKAFAEFLCRPDVKQLYLSQFQKDFNDFQDLLRIDPDVKCELHQRVDDLRDRLWNICDDRKDQAEKERGTYVNSGWMEDRLGLLSNYFATLMQAEIDKFSDTVKLLRDYYSSALDGQNWVINEEESTDGNLIRLPLVELPITNIEATPIDSNSRVSSAFKKKKVDDMISVSSNNDSKKIPMIKRNSILTESKTKIETKKKIKDQSIGEEPTALANLNKDIDSKIMSDIVSQASLIVDRISAAEIQRREEEEQKKKLEEAQKASNEKIKAGKKTPAKGKTPLPIVSTEPEPISVEEIKVIANKEKARQEYYWAIEQEAKDVRKRINLIYSVSTKNLSDLKQRVEATFDLMYDWIGKQFLQEMASIDMVTEVAKYAIENCTKINEQLVITQTEFFIQEDVKLIRTPTPPPMPDPEEIIRCDQFSIVQLRNILCQLKYEAPTGLISRKEFETCICNMIKSLNVNDFLPEYWIQLDQSKIERLSSEFSTFLMDTNINWRQFMLHACQPWPVPTQSDLLLALDIYRRLDQYQSGFITREQFLFSSSQIWITKHEERNILVYDRMSNLLDIIFDIFAIEYNNTFVVDYMSLLQYFSMHCNGYNGFMRALSVVTGQHMPHLPLLKIEALENFDLQQQHNDVSILWTSSQVDIQKEYINGNKTDQEIETKTDGKIGKKSAEKMDNKSETKIDIKIENDSEINNLSKINSENIVEPEITLDPKEQSDWLDEIPETAKYSTITIDALVKVLNLGLSVEETLDVEFKKDDLLSIFDEMGATEFEAVSWISIFSHPYIQMMLNKCRIYTAVDTNTILFNS